MCSEKGQDEQLTISKIATIKKFSYIINMTLQFFYTIY